MIVREHVDTPRDVLGTGMVELFDDRTGRLYRREKFENFVSKAALAYQRWYVRSDYTRSAPGISTDLTPQNPFSHLCTLSTSAAEDPATEAYPGPIIAYSTKAAYSGADPLKGGLNIAESAQTPTSMKWVCDWVAGSGNGTFQSVGWCAIDEGAISMGYQPAIYKKMASDAPSMAFRSAAYPSIVGFGLASDPATGYLYMLNKSTTMVNRINQSTGAVIGADLFTDPDLFLAYDSSGTPGFWSAVAATGTNPCLIKRNFAGATIATVPTTWTAIFGSALAPKSIAFGNGSLWAINANQPKVFRINPTTGATTVLDMTGKVTDFTTLCIDPDGNIITCSLSGASDSNTFSYIYILFYARWDLAGNMLNNWLNRTPSTPGTLYTPTGNMVYHDDLHYCFLSTSGPRLSVADLRHGFGTRTLLASPVTKDSSKTMKITYTFNYV